MSIVAKRSPISATAELLCLYIFLCFHCVASLFMVSKHFLNATRPRLEVICYTSDVSLQVHVNGFVSLGSPPYPPSCSSYPQLYLYDYFRYYYSVIAPFWADIDLYFTDGVVYLGHISRSSAEESVTPQAAEVFDAVRQLVLKGAGDVGFLPTEVITVTWQNVSPYPAYWYQSEVRACL